MIDTVEALIELHEGRIPYVYTDSLGYQTIGVGHLVDRKLNGRLPEPIIDALRDWDVREATQALETALPWAQGLTGPRKAALVDMSFNLGIKKLLGFKMTLGFLEQGDFESASKSMMASLWAKQVGPRANRLSKMFLTGAWPND